MADMKAATYENYFHGPDCKCDYDREVRRRKNPATPQEVAAAAASAKAILDERRAQDAEREAREREVLQFAGHLEQYIQSVYVPKPPATEDVEAKRLRDKERAEKEFMSRGRK